MEIRARAGGHLVDGEFDPLVRALRGYDEAVVLLFEFQVRCFASRAPLGSGGLGESERCEEEERGDSEKGVDSAGLHSAF